jgi:hypothetical protein
MSTGVFKMVDGETIELTEEENNQRIADGEASQAAHDATCVAAKSPRCIRRLD